MRALEELRRPQRTCLAPAIFGGADASGRACFIAQPEAFDAAAMLGAAAALPATLAPDERLGAALAAAICSCRFERGRAAAAAAAVAAAAANDAASAHDAEAYAHVRAAVELAAAAAAAEHALEAVAVACDGLCAPAAVRSAALSSLQRVVQLAAPLEASHEHALFASYASYEWDAAAPRAGGEALSGREFAALCHVWEVLRLDATKATQHKRGAGPEYTPFALALARVRCGHAFAGRLRRRLSALQPAEAAPGGGPLLNGRSLEALEWVAPRQRASLLTQLNVLCRLRGDADEAVVAQPQQLVRYLHARCPGLLEQLRAGWATDWGRTYDGD